MLSCAPENKIFDVQSGFLDLFLHFNYVSGDVDGNNNKTRASKPLIERTPTHEEVTTGKHKRLSRALGQSMHRRKYNSRVQLIYEENFHESLASTLLLLFAILLPFFLFTFLHSLTYSLAPSPPINPTTRLDFRPFLESFLRFSFGGGAWAHFPNSGWLSSLPNHVLSNLLKYILIY